MSTRRTARVASVIREVVSTAILQELRDPRIRNVTVLGAEVSADLRYAKIRISVMGSDRDASLTLHGLHSARGYLQSRVADHVRTRYTPELRFELDQGIRRSFEAARILQDVLPTSDSDESAAHAAAASAAPAASDDAAEAPPGDGDAASDADSDH